jgi:uncharacterized protein (TIGR03000 family)
MRALLWSVLVGSVALVMTATTPSQAEARWWGRRAWSGYGRFGWWRPGWGGYYPSAPLYPGLYAYPYFGYPLYGYYPPYGYNPTANYASMSTVSSPAAASSNEDSEAQLPHPTGGVLAPPANAGVIRLHVPDEFATVTFNGHAIDSIGTTRIYVTPDLEPGKSLRYEIKVSGFRRNQRTIHEALVEARPGQINTVDFTRVAARAAR